jgi:chitinase
MSFCIDWLRVSSGIGIFAWAALLPLTGCQDGGPTCDPAIDCARGSTTTPTGAGAGTGGSGPSVSSSTGSSGGVGSSGSLATTGTGNAASGSGGATGSSGAGSGGTGGAPPPIGDASRPFPGRVVAYLPTYRGSYTTWASSLAWSRVTHVNIAFATPSGSSFALAGQSDASIAALVNAAHTAGVKVLFSIGGANDGSVQIAAQYTPTLVDGFVANLIAYLAAHNLDGIDVDVEGNPVNADYGPFIGKLAAKLHPSGKLLTSALGDWFGDRVPASAYALFDFINVMSYDHCGSWTTPCEHSTYDQAVNDLTFFRNKGVPADRLHLGVPFYGYCWGTGCPAAAMTYADILAKWPGVPDWYVAGGLTLSYNTSATIQKKAQLAKGYGGMMAWELGQDASGDQSLLKILTDSL